MVIGDMRWFSDGGETVTRRRYARGSRVRGLEIL